MDYSGKIIKKTPVTPSQTSASGVWTLDDAIQAQKTNTWPVANVPNPISRSLRFRSSASAYLNRTPASAGSRTTWTYSAWVKRGAIGTNAMALYWATNGVATEDAIRFDTGDNFNFYIYGASGYVGQLNTTAVYRDPSAWYHIVAVWNTTSGTASERMKLYINGVQVTSFNTATYPSQNAVSDINNNVAQYISRLNSNYFDGYLTELNFIDGQALDPTYFGGTNAVTGVWEPRAYTGTYGTNGFYLNFKDNTSTTTLGYDYSGNGNNWTTNNISLTAGSTYDSMLDVPTQWVGYNTGDVASVTRGNYAVLNPLYKSQSLVKATLANGNLSASVGGSDAYVEATFAYPTTGKYYHEVQVLSSANLYTAGIAQADTSNGTTYVSNGQIYQLGSIITTTTAWSVNDIIGIAVDMDTNQATFYRNNTLVGTWTAYVSANDCYPSSYLGSGSTGTLQYNFGQRPFSYTPPSGYLSLCTTNLSSPTILQGDDYFNAVTWTGANTSAGNSVTGVGFKPDFVWAKVRSQAYSHLLYDALRGTGSAAELSTDSTGAEGSTSASERGYLNSFDSDGFSSVVGSNGDNLYFNQTSQTYVAWNWKASNAAGVTNTSGSITSTVSANQTSGFSIVTYTGTGSAATVGHGLGVAPSMIIVKQRSLSGNNWQTYHSAIGNTKALFLDTTDSSATNSVYWNNTSPTSTVFSIGTSANANQNTTTYVAYCFAAVAGYSAFGSYTGNGSSDGPFVYLGFRPKYVMIKRSDTGGTNWWVYDSARGTYNAVVPYLEPNTSSSEGTGYPLGDFVANGFKIRNTVSNINASGGTYIYMAFAENPFKNALAR